jgi:hypothetical protein
LTGYVVKADHNGVAGNLFEIVPKLTEEIKKVQAE